MKKLPSTMSNMLLSLTLICSVSAALLAWMYNVTLEPIRQIEVKQRLDAIRSLAPKFDNDPSADKWNYTTPEGISCTVFPAMLDNRLNGGVVEASSMDGFAGEIKIMCGFDSKGQVIDYRVMSHAETPGLGAKMDSWFRDPSGNRSIIGKSPASTPFYVTKDKDAGGRIDGITAATISSRAFLQAVRSAFEAYMAYQSGEPSSANHIQRK